MPRSLRLPDDLASEIKELSQKHERSEHGEIIYALRQYVKKAPSLDWSQFDLSLSDEDAADIEREAEMRKLRADYRWIEDCQHKSIEALKEVVAGSEEDYQNPLNLRRHRQAVIVLEARERANQ
jgi:predicted transcriptional regulator